MRMVVLALAGLLATACPSAARSDPLTVDVILGLESFGRVAIDPSGAVAVFEERRARGDLPRHDLEAEGANRYARLYRIDLDDPDRPRPLLAMEDDAGYSVGAFSPGGRRLAVFRLRNDEWRLGIVELATGHVVWTEVAPELGLWGRSLEWLTDDALVALGTADGALPPRLAGPRAEQARLLALRAAATAGSPAAITVGEDGPPEALPARRLWRIDAVTGEAAAIVDGPFLDLEASPDGRYAALLRDGPLLPPPAADTASEVRRARGLEIVDLTTGAAIQPPEAGNISTSLLAWSPASDALLLAAIGDGPARLLTVAPDGAARDVTPVGAHPTTPIDFQGMATAEGGWLDESPIFKGRSVSREGWFVAGADAPLPGLSPDARLVAEGRSSVLFASSGRVIRLGADGESADLGAAASAVNPRGPFGLRAQSGPLKADFAVIERPDGRLCQIWADPGTEPRCVAARPGAAISWSREIGLDRSGPEAEPNTLRLQRGHSREVVWRLNPELDRIAVAAPRRVTGVGGAGGWLYSPLNPTAAPPVIVVPYQGEAYPAPPWWMRRESTSLSLAPQLMVAAGYAILIPDLLATPEPADGLAQRILAVVDAAAAEGLVDAERIGLWGWSFGGWSAVMSAAQSPRFDAVVALNGPMNFSTVIGDVGSTLRLEGGHALAATAGARWLESGQAEMRDAYWRAPDRYRRNSPFEQADRITAPTLLVVGEYDLMLGQSEQLYGALHRLNRPVALTLLIGEDHGVQSPGNIRLYYDQVRDWFDRHLRGSGGPAVPASDAPRPPPAPD
ncbi:prolyl oligopeptidase family serine peptidase [Brevundimonas sp. SORGH_AS_0993]|uniref:S9 family peptidase n=1 Tax=Brevundimonas sp. SORGH_AS_0993 TaxID=3041794 RepID=UPI0027836E6E|nr:prolyl oligopeptidase family serine peptidase [Brevundimonas sp. SORGH_AS_0993]MDQ1153087.1 dipeptidyl aminopeptidase/acylaminoacyl peptidase [Brevundimonas sp. SORGH_AS_0993]